MLEKGLLDKELEDKIIENAQGESCVDSHLEQGHWVAIKILFHNT